MNKSDHREWFFVIKLLPKFEPTVTFDVTESQLVPVRTIDEAERYFSQVDDLLHRQPNIPRQRFIVMVTGHSEKLRLLM